MRADRLLSLLMLLQARGRMTAEQLSAELEVSERTIYRDLEALNAAGVPVLAERGPGGGCMLPERYRTNLTGLTESEVRGLFLSVAPGPLADLGLGKAIDAAMLKLSASLPTVHRRELERVRSRIHIDTAEWFRPEEPVPHLKTIEEAVWQEKRLAISYTTSSGARVKRYVHPYGLVAKAGVWYLVASSRTNTVTYRVSRVREAEVLPDGFERPSEFNLAAYWEQQCSEFEAGMPSYTVRLRVAPDCVSFLPAFLGEWVRQPIEEADPPDREGWISLALTFESFDVARGNMLAMGTGVEVLDPPELRRSVAGTARSIANYYLGGNNP
ncbi:MAG TPA: WYL domain-containing protein [Chloroflexia bacterium]|nr:WYL domain-containing protein [Chloroflexia bacterium]